MLNGLKPIYSEVIQVDDDWESLISEGMEARSLKDKSQWILGKLADRVNTRYGSDAIGVFATSIGVNKSSLLRYRDVYRKFKGKDINPALSFSHHLKVSTEEEPELWLNRAYENNWSVEKLGLELDRFRGNRNPSKKCKICGGYKAEFICKCNNT